MMRFKQARKVFKRIACINGVKDYDSEFLFDTEIVIMKCKRDELTADCNLNETRKTEKKFRNELKIK